MSVFAAVIILCILLVLLPPSNRAHYRLAPGAILPMDYKPYPGAPDMHYAPRCSYCGNRGTKDRCDSCGAPK